LGVVGAVGHKKISVGLCLEYALLHIWASVVLAESSWCVGVIRGYRR
jgi:hypothetical protein